MKSRIVGIVNNASLKFASDELEFTGLNKPRALRYKRFACKKSPLSRLFSSVKDPEDFCTIFRRKLQAYIDQTSGAYCPFGEYTKLYCSLAFQYKFLENQFSKLLLLSDTGSAASQSSENERDPSLPPHPKKKQHELTETELNKVIQEKHIGKP